MHLLALLNSMSIPRFLCLGMPRGLFQISVGESHNLLVTWSRQHFQPLNALFIPMTKKSLRMPAGHFLTYQMGPRTKYNLIIEASISFSADSCISQFGTWLREMIPKYSLISSSSLPSVNILKL